MKKKPFFEEREDLYLMKYMPRGVCSREIEFDIVDNKVRDVKFVGGCSGNTQGVARLIEGMDVHDAIDRLSGIDCKGKGTSCPDQLSKALREAIKEA